jgi:hypothetical protein
MRHTWQKPDFEEISVSGECTAYSGAMTPWDRRQASAPANEPEPVGSVRPGPMPVGESPPQPAPHRG